MLHGSTTLTFETWFRTTGSGGILGYENVAYPGSPGNWVPVLYVGSDGKLRGEYWIGLNPITSASSVADGQWHHVALVGQVNTQALYLDGVLLGSHSGTINHLNMLNNQIGMVRTTSWPAGNGGWYSLQGDMDETR